MSTWKLKKKCDLGDIKRIKGETHTIFNFNSPFLFLSRYKCLWRVCLCILSDQASFSLIFFPQMNLAKVKKWVISIPFSLLSEPKMRQSLRFKPQGSLMNNVDSQTPGRPSAGISHLGEVHRIWAHLHSRLLVNVHLQINFVQRHCIWRERYIFETIGNVFVKLKLNPFFVSLISAIFPKQVMKEGINLKSGLP